MTTLELYSVYERGFIMMIRDLKKFLERTGHSIILNDTEKIDTGDYSISFKTIYCHNYETDPFVSSKMPEEEDAFYHYFPSQCDVGFQIMNFVFKSNENHHTKQEIDIELSAYLLPDNKTIKLSFTINPYGNPAECKTTEYELYQWKKQLCTLSEYILEKL